MTTTLAKEIEATYEVLAKMGEGGMGAVYKVRHRFFDEIRVIKVMQSDLQATDELNERFLSEAKRGKQLRHPNLAEVLDFSIAADGTAYIVMEYIEGINLRQLLTAKGGPIDYRRVIGIAEQALAALAFLHSKKFVHRDISPDNLMLTRDADGRERVKLIDLGVARSLESTRRLTMVGKFIGKVRYASPEQFSGETDARSDIYSLGLVLYELLTNEKPITGEDHFSIITGHLNRPPRPFDETDPRQLVPLPLREVVLKALEKKPEDRFQSAEEFAPALRAALEPYEVTLPETTVVTMPSSAPLVLDRTIEIDDRTVADTPPSSRRWLVIAAIVAVVIGGALMAVWMQSKDDVAKIEDVKPTNTVAETSVTITAPATTAIERPAVVARGQLLINAYPWGQVVSVRSASGEEHLGSPAETPLLLSLPAGSYDVRLFNPNSKRTASLRATVTEGSTAGVEAELDVIDANAYVSGVGIGE